MFGLYAFNALNLNERADALWDGGTFIVATDHPEGRSAFTGPSPPSGPSEGSTY